MDTPPNGNLKIQHIIRALFEHVILFLKAVKSPIYLLLEYFYFYRYYINISQLIFILFLHPSNFNNAIAM